jgi:protein gp37
MFGDWIPNEWIVNIKNIIHQCPQHIFQLLTKNPRRMAEWSWPQNVWAGTTVTTQAEIERIEIIKQVHAKIRFVCFEPILGPIDYPSFKGIDWIIIGAESVGKSYIPRDAAAAQRWATPLIAQIKKEGIPLFLKPNLQWPEQIKELPLGTAGVET